MYVKIVKMKAYAIDFGTTHSLLCSADGNKWTPPLALDPYAADPTLFRTILFFPNRSQLYYGARAIDEFVANDLMGRLVRSFKKFLPVKSMIGTYVDDRPINLEDLVGFFLKEMRIRANAILGEEIDVAVLGRPAKYSPDPALDLFAEERMRKAARLAGFKYVEFCPEPVAAARAFKSELNKEQLVCVADFGGGTSDYTVVRLGPKAFSPDDVLGIGGVSIAGDALDGQVMRKRISNHFGAQVKYQVPFGSNILTMPVSLMEKICTPAEISLLRKRDTIEFFRNVKTWSLGKDDKRVMDQLFTLLENQLGFGVFEKIEKAKRDLSDQSQAHLDMEYPDHDRPEIKIHEVITRANFDEMIHDSVDKILQSLDDTLKQAGVSASEIDLLCLTGGTAKVGIIKDALIARFGEQKVKAHKHFHSIVEGLAEHAVELSNRS